MSEDFEPSPRATKRRKTSQYGKHRTVLPEEGSLIEETSAIVQAEEDDQYVNAEEEHVTTPSKDASVSKGAQRTPRSQRSSSRVSKKKELTNGSTRSSRSVSSTKSAGQFTRSEPRGKEQVQQVEDAEDQIGSEKENENDLAVNGTTSRNGSTMEGDQDTAQTRSSGRQRKKPARYMDVEPEALPVVTKHSTRKGAEAIATQHIVDSPLLKGILTPSKKQHAGPRKSVVFSQDVDTIGEQFGFKDINSHIKPTPRRPQKLQTATVNEPKNDHQASSTDQPTPLDEVEDVALDPMLMDDHQDIELPLPLFSPHQEDHIPPLPCLPIASQENPQLLAIKTTILSRLTSTSKPPKSPPTHLSSQHQALHTLLTATIASGESNSLLLLGPRGSGKSHLLDISLASLAADFGPDFFHTVRLSGFFQTDDRLALREIWRQLGREMQVDEAETEDVAGSYADTMASLLSLLSHPDDMVIDGAIDTGDSAARRTAKSIVFVLDEFDLFTTHPRQTLLYNLFDVAQSRKAPIAVVGCSTRMDVIECLEKRVKSRFSHRWLLVPGCASFAEWEACVKVVLTVDDSAAGRGNDALQLVMDEQEQGWMGRWDEYIVNHFMKTEEVQRLMKSHFYTTKALPDLFMALYPLIATLDLSATNATAQATSATKALQHRQYSSQYNSGLSVLSVLPTLPALHFALLISATRLITIHCLPAVNFNLVHAHYTELMTRSKLQQTAHGSVAVGGILREWSRETCRETWETLGRWGLIVPVTGQGSESGTDGMEGEETRMWRCEVSLEEVEWGIKEKFGNAEGLTSTGQGEVLAKWCREV